MNSNQALQIGCYKAALTQNRRHSLHALLLSNLSIAQVRQKTPPWPSGLRQGRKPSSGSPGLIRQRLRIENQARQMFPAALLEAVTVKNSYGLCHKNPNGPDPLFAVTIISTISCNKPDNEPVTFVTLPQPM
jgi:hypothetical protein